MARKKLTLTEEHIALLKNIRFGEIMVSHPEKDLDWVLDKINATLNEISGEDNEVRVDIIRKYLNKVSMANGTSKLYAELDKGKYFGVDTYDLFGGNTMELIARCIGCYDKVIEGTEEDYTGPKFPPDVTDHIHDLYHFIVENFSDIEELIHQRAFKGGIQPDVTYVSFDYEHLWFTEEEFEEHRKTK